jgi:hypothetical protein
MPPPNKHSVGSFNKLELRACKRVIVFVVFVVIVVIVVVMVVIVIHKRAIIKASPS